MSRKLEGKKQDDLLALWRAQGLIVQKFNDMYFSGIADTLVALPGPPPPGIPQAMWLELKATDEVPKRKRSPWWADCRPEPNQMAWLKQWDVLHPAAMVLFTPLGWTAVPIRYVDAFFELPHTETRTSNEKPTYGRIVEAIRSWNFAV